MDSPQDPAAETQDQVPAELVPDVEIAYQQAIADVHENAPILNGQPPEPIQTAPELRPDLSLKKPNTPRRSQPHMKKPVRATLAETEAAYRKWCALKRKTQKRVSDKIAGAKEELISARNVWLRLVLNRILQLAGQPPGSTSVDNEALKMAIPNLKATEIGRELLRIAEIDKIVTAPEGPQTQKIEGEITIRGDGPVTFADFLRFADRGVMGN